MPTSVEVDDENARNTRFFDNIEQFGLCSHFSRHRVFRISCEEAALEARDEDHIYVIW